MILIENYIQIYHEVAYVRVKFSMSFHSRDLKTGSWTWMNRNEPEQITFSKIHISR